MAGPRTSSPGRFGAALNRQSRQRYRRLRRELSQSFLGLAGVVLTGTVGYHLIERFSWLDSLYLTVITLATVGYGDVAPLTPQGRFFTILLIFAGLLSVAYIVNRFTEALVQGYFQQNLRERRQRNVFEKLNQHYIICGYGRMGRQVAREFDAEGLAFVILDSEPEAIAEAQESGYLVMAGDATLDEVLTTVGVERARCLVAVMPSDANNLYTILSAKALNPGLRAIARASSEEAIPKLQRAGADAIVSPYVVGGRRMAAAALRPQMIDFVDGITSASERSLHMEEFLLEDGRCSCVGRTLQEADVRGQSGALILAIRRADGELIPGPTAQVQLRVGDLLICLGTTEQLQRLEQLLEGHRF